MSWTKSTTTKHTCGGPTFGRKTPGCPRCDELLAGDAPVTWDWADKKRRDEEMARRSIAAHFAPGGRHARGECGPVCTFGDW
jgi:hypothetical protein